MNALHSRDFHACSLPLAQQLLEGSVVVFSSLMPHRTGPNVTAGVRKSYILQYAPDGARIVQTDTACDAPDRQYLILKNGDRVSPRLSNSHSAFCPQHKFARHRIAIRLCSSAFICK